MKVLAVALVVYYSCLSIAYTELSGTQCEPKCWTLAFYQNLHILVEDKGSSDYNHGVCQLTDSDSFVIDRLASRIHY